MDFSGNNGNYAYFEEENAGVLRFLPEGKRVLDVGCGYGVLGPQLKRRNNYVVGLDLNGRAIEAAARRFDEAHVADITRIDALPNSCRDPFDVIVFTDILEHVYNPSHVLEDYRALLKDDGYIIVSVPNVAAWHVRIGLLFGQWNYKQTGILDKTHVRFLTKKSARRLLQQSGYRIVGTNITPGLVRVVHPIVRWFFNRSGGREDNPAAITESKAYRLYRKWVYPLEAGVARLWSGALAFQFIFKAEKQIESIHEHDQAGPGNRRIRLYRQPPLRRSVAAW